MSLHVHKRYFYICSPLLWYFCTYSPYSHTCHCMCTSAAFTSVHIRPSRFCDTNCAHIHHTCTFLLFLDAHGIWHVLMILLHLCSMHRYFAILSHRCIFSGTFTKYWRPAALRKPCTAHWQKCAEFLWTFGDVVLKESNPAMPCNAPCKSCMVHCQMLHRCLQCHWLCCHLFLCRVIHCCFFVAAFLLSF